MKNVFSVSTGRLMKDDLKREKALTIIEIIFSFSIFLLIISLMFIVTGRGRISWTESSAMIFLHSQARRVSQQITRELMFSNPTRIFLSSAEANGSFDHIRFSVPVADRNTGILKKTNTGELQWGSSYSQGNSIIYFKKKDKLIRQVIDSGSNIVNERIIAQNITGFKVVKNNPYYEIKLNFYISKYSGISLTEPIHYPFIIAVTPRN